MEKRKPWNFCETPEEKCTMNYCDDNGCLNRKRHLSKMRKYNKYQMVSMLIIGIITGLVCGVILNF